MIEQIFYTEGYPVISFSICKVLQAKLYIYKNELNFKKLSYNYNPKLFETKEEALEFIRKALLNKETHIQNDYYKYYIIEFNRKLNRMNRLNILV